MMNPHHDWSDKKYFFGWVNKKLLQKFSLIEQILSVSELDELIFSRVLSLGYDRKKSTHIHEKISKTYLHDDYTPIHLALPEMDFCETALAQIIQEIVNTKTISKQDLEFLDKILVKYDPLLPDDYLNLKPADIKLPEFQKETWTEDILWNIPENIGGTNEFTIYSSSRVEFTYFSNMYYESEDITTAVIPSKYAVKYRELIQQLNHSDLLNMPIDRRLEDFKQLSTTPDKDMLFRSILVIKINDWTLHSPNELVRLDEKFIQENGLSWSSTGVLDLEKNNEKIVKYELWASPFDENSHTRRRIASGVRLRIKSEFLQNYLKDNEMSLIVLYSKKHVIYKTNIQEVREIKSNEINKCVIYASDTVN